MNTLEFRFKVQWIRRRARRIQRFYSVSRALAVFDAHRDWIDMHPATRLTHLVAIRQPLNLNCHHEQN
jgi:hypothetical protein